MWAESTSPLERLLLGPLGEMLSYAAVARSRICLEMPGRQLSNSYLSFHIQHPFLVSFTFSFLLGAPPWRQPRQRCYKQDMGSLEICSKQERLKVFNSIPAVNKDKGGSAVWSRESVSDGFALPCHLLKQETNIFLAFAKERIP